MKYILGLDISRYEPNVDWGLIRAQGVQFVIIKASEGTSYKDPMFATHWANAKNAGLIRGAYHYLRAGDDPNLQAQSFLASVKLERGDLPPFLDLEGTYNDGQTNEKFVSCAGTWLAKVAQATGRKPYVYSTGSFLNEHLSINSKAPTWAKNYGVWIANYLYTYVEGVSRPVEASGWPSWEFWQYTNHGDIQGITTDTGQKPSEIDLNWYRGTLQDLYTLVGLQQAPPVLVQPPVQPPAAQSSAKYIVKAGDTLSAIAAQNHVTLDALLAVNPNLLQAGMQINLPASVSTNPPPVVTPPVVKPPVVTPPVVQPPVTTPPPVVPTGPIQYTVQPGDSLTRIAAKYGVTVDAISRANNISDPNLIQIGQKLIIPK